MAYVNFFGFHSMLLSASNLVAGALCATAIVLITTLRDRAAAPVVVDEMPTHEFVALRAAVLARESQPRTCHSRPARRGTARARTTSAAARTTHA
jgi:hypothetical protein